MSKIFVTSDTWFNRLITDDRDAITTDVNESIIKQWNSVVSKDDKVYILGGFGIGDLYHIVVRLHGELHFLNNYGNEKMFLDRMVEELGKSSEQNIKSKVVFENEQVLTLDDYDCILSYNPLIEWRGQSSGVFCFHGLNDDNYLTDYNISCKFQLGKMSPIDIGDVKDNILDMIDKL